MNTDKRHFVLCLILVLLLAATGHALAQGAGTTPEPTATPVPKTPLPVPESPVVTLDSNIVTTDGVDTETGDFVITSSNTSQFDNAESVEWIAANESTRDVEEDTIAPADAGTIRIGAQDLGYQAGDIISFSLTSLAALDDETYSDSPSLIFCYPVHESCRDPRTLIRSLPPPLGATIALVTPEPPAEGEAQAQTSGGGGTITISIPEIGSVITNAQGYNWQADNSDGNSASGTENRGNGQAQAEFQAQAQAEADAQAVESTEVIQFGADLIDFQEEEAIRITLRALAPSGSNRYVDSHPVVYYYCTDPNVNCPNLWGSSPPGGDGDDGDGGDGGTSGTCLNTDGGAPIKVCANADYTSYTLYGVYQDSSVQSLVSVTSASSLCGAKAAADNNLASGTNVATNKAYTVSYDGDCTMTLSTYYADKGPDVDKPYVNTIDEHHTVRYVQW